jgi:hypothetical protein
MPEGIDPEVVRIYRHWVLAYGKTRHALTPKRVAAIERCLGDGIDADTCIAWIEYIGSLQDQNVSSRTALPDLTTLFRDNNVKRLRNRFGLSCDPPVNWLTPFEGIWVKHYPGSQFPFAMAARPLREAVEHHEESGLLPEFDADLARTGVDFVNFYKFAAGVPHWRRQPAKGPNASRVGGDSSLMPSDRPVTVVRE